MKSRKVKQYNKQSKRKRPQREESHTKRTTVSSEPRVIRAAKETSGYLSKTLKDSKQPEPAKSIILDEWQKEAVNLLLDGRNVIVDAPTTAGKTKVVEAFLESQLADSNFSAIYTTPVKSLSNDKLLEFREKYGSEQVGIATGDIKDNLDAPIVVATLESFRNSLLGVGEKIEKNLVIFDEYHFLQDQSRGSAWEESIILTPHKTQILMLSASVENPGDFANWLEKIKKRSCQVVKTDFRPVPLKSLLFHGGKWLLADSIKLPKANKKDERWRFPAPQQEVAESIVKIEKLNLTPCILYAGQRLSSENLCKEIANNLEPLPKEKQQAITENLNTLIKKLDSGAFIGVQVRKLITKYGVAYHHSGLGPPARLTIENLLKGGHLRFCVATMGLSIGINFSVRSALISDYRRPGADGIVQYPPAEVLQMLGRAGRRGRDKVGFSLWPNHHALQKFPPAQREHISSQLKSDPHTFLGLLGRGFNLNDIERFYAKSFLAESVPKSNFKLLTRKLIAATIGDCQSCISPAHNWAHRDNDEVETCKNCIKKMSKHPEIRKVLKQQVTNIHLHLHRIGCIDENEQLTEFGSLARYFPQSGGLLLASLLSSQELDLDNLGITAELMGSLSIAFFKKPRTSKDYDFPFVEDGVQEELEFFYPYNLFPEYYDEPFGNRNYPVFKGFNPAGGYLIKEWLAGVSWQHLSQIICHSKFHQGDLTNCIYRTATFIQSITQSTLTEMKSPAKDIWQLLVRPPLTPIDSQNQKKPKDMA